MTGDLDRVKEDDPFLVKYQPSDLRIASEFLKTWLPFLSRDLCHECTQILSDRIRSLDPELDGEAEALHFDKSVTSLSPDKEESGETKENSEDNRDTHSQVSGKDGDDTNSLASWKDGASGCCEPHTEASSSGLTSGSPSVDPTRSLSWADMAQEDELEVEEEEESELNERVVNMSPLSGDLTVTKVIEKTKENSEDNRDTHSQVSGKDGDDTNSLASWKDGASGCCEPHTEASSSGLTSGSPSVDTTRSPRISWADMAQEDELEVEEEEESELNKRVVNVSPLSGDLTVTKVIEKPKLSRDQREYIRFMNVERKKDYICLERIKGKIVNILEGLELHSGVFSAAEQKRIVEEVYALEEKGKRGELKERTYSAPKKLMRGKGRVTMQFGCCYNYAIDKLGNTPGILHKEIVDPLPSLFKVIIRRLVLWHILPPSCVPDSCIVNIYEEGDCIPPHIDNHDFIRPFCTVSFLSECNILFGSNLKILHAGEFAGSFAICLPVGSVLVLNGNGADVAKHCVPSVPMKRISITFRKMDESKRPIGFVPEPDLQGIQPLSYEKDKAKRFDSPKSDGHTKRQPFRRHANDSLREVITQSEPHYPTRSRQVPIYKRSFRMNPDN